MNKEIVSFVLATVLSVGLGVGSAFAAYDEYAQEFNKSYGDGVGTKTIMVGSTKSNDLVGNITTMFGYYAGTLVSATSAGGNVTLYDSSGARFSVTDVGNSWNVTSVNFKASDFDVNEMNSRVDNESLSEDEKENIKRDLETRITAEVRIKAEENARTKIEEEVEKNFVKGKDEEGNDIEETDSQFAERKARAVNDKVKQAGQDAVDTANKNGSIASEVESRRASAEAIALKNKQDKVKADWFNETMITMGVNPQVLKQIATDPDTGAILSANTFSNADETPQIYKWTDSEGKEHSKIFVQGDHKLADGTGDYLETHISAEFIDKLVETLNSGINMSGSIQFGDTFSGPTLVVSQNGKTMATYQSDSSMNGGLIPTSLYRYDEKGFVNGVEIVTYNATNTDNGFMTLEPTVNYTKISYNKNGVRTDTAYRFSEFSTNPEDVLKNGKVGTAVKVEDKTVKGDDGKDKIEEENPVKDQLKNYDALKVSETRYTANNSILSSIDYTSGNTTYYGGDGQPRYVNNDLGVTIGIYTYTANGVASSYFNAEGRDSEGKKVGTTTFFDEWGRQLFSAVGNKDLSSQKNNLVAEYEKGLKDGFKGTLYQYENGEAKLIDGSGTTISNIQIYADQILDTNNQAIMTNGYLDMKKVNSYVTNSKNDVSNILNKSINLDRFGFKTNMIQRALIYSNGPSTVLFQATIGTGGALSAKELIEENIEQLVEDGKLTETTVDKVETSLSTQVTANETKGGKFNDYTKTGDVLSDNSVYTGSDYVYSCSSYRSVYYSGIVFYGGAAAYGTFAKQITDIIGATKTEEKNIQRNLTVGGTKVTDPAVEGTLFPEGASENEILTMAENLGIDVNDEKAMDDLRNGFYTDKETGKTYAIVNASSINIMDGSGFQVAKGETVFVEIDAGTRSLIETQFQKTGDRKIMFMGDVREGVSKDADGKVYLTMTMNTSYGDGLIQGNKAVQEAKNEIMLVSVGAAVVNGADIGELQSKLESYNEINGTNFTMEKASSSYEEAKTDSNKSWIITNTNENMIFFDNQAYDYRAGWNLLVGKAVLTTSADENKTPALF